MMILVLALTAVGLVVKLKKKLLGASSSGPLAIEDALVVKDKEVDLLVEDLFEVDPKAAVVNVKTTAAEEQAVYDFPSSIVKVPDESNVRAVVDAAVLVGMAMGAALLLQETKKEAKRRRSAPRRAMPALVPIQMLVSVPVPVPVLNSVAVFQRGHQNDSISC